MPPEYVFAVCKGSTLKLPAQLVWDFQAGVEIAREATERTGMRHSVWPLKTPDWHGLCGNCGKHWIPHCPPPTYCPDAVGV
jgi:ribosomal protein L32